MENQTVHLTIENNLGIVTFNDKDNLMNTFTDNLQEGLVEAIYSVNDLVAEGKVKGVIFISGKPDTFHAGGNLKSINETSTKFIRMRGIEFLQAILNKISSIKVPTLTAINGHCLGGGLELALACSARIAKESPNTIIGLPEASVGLFPAAGGTQRLPRLIGYPAIDLILNAQVMPVQKAFDAGIIDRVVPKDQDLLNEAKTFLMGVIEGTEVLNRPVHDFSNIDDVIAEIRQKHLKKNKGRLLPAPKAILTVIREGLKGSLSEGLELEKRHFPEVAMSPEFKGLSHTFFMRGMTGNPQKLMRPGFTPKDIRKIAILGYGSMGRGLVINCLKQMQVPIVVKDNPEALEAGNKFVLKTLNGMYEKKRLKMAPDELMKLVTVTSDFDSNFVDVDLTIEAIIENLDAKIELFDGLCKVVKNDCLLATNTSGLSVNELARYVSNPERFGGLHYFSPVWMMELVEIVRGEKTSQDTIDNFINFAGSMKKRPLICNDNPGFVVNAMLAPFGGSGLKYAEEGNPIEKVEKAFIDFGFPVPPLKLMDLVGIDIVHFINVNRGTPKKTLANLYNAGFHGLAKSGKGIYQADGSLNPEAVALFDKQDPPIIRTEEEMVNDLLLQQITIAKDLLDRKIVDEPVMIDIGMIYGAGYPKDKGGPLKWADSIGLSERVYGKKFYDV